MRPTGVKEVLARRAPVNLATTIIRDRGITFADERDVLMPSLLINMEKVFEAYLRNVLRLRLPALASSVQVLDGTRGGSEGAKKLLFDKVPSPDAEPDIVIRHPTPPDETPSTAVILDVKYKKLSGLPDRADINQVVTYAVSYRSPSVVLIHPWTLKNTHGLRRIGVMDQIELYQYAFNLGADDLDAEEMTFSSAMAGIS